MSDLIGKLSEIRSEYNCFDENEEPYYRALSEAIKILSRRADGDTISRQDAIDALDGEITVTGRANAEAVRGYARLVADRLKRLPPAQPEIIRCTECKHYREYDSEYVANAVVVQCMADRYPISETIPDGWFCAGAERKDDE